MGHLNDLNLKLRGNNMFVHKLYSCVQVLKAKLSLFSRQMTNKCFTHFSTLAPLDVHS